MIVSSIERDQRRIEFHSNRAVRSDKQVWQISGIVRACIEQAMNDRGLLVNVSSGILECRIATIGLLVKVHAMPTRRQAFRLDTKQDTARSRCHGYLTDHCALRVF